SASTRRSPSSTLFPYTTLFRSLQRGIDFDALFVAVFKGTLAMYLDSWAGCCEIRNQFMHHQHGDFEVEQVCCNYDTNEWLLCTLDRKSTRLNSSHVKISYAVFC